MTFPEFQQNGSAKQFTHGKIKYYRLGTYLLILYYYHECRSHARVGSSILFLIIFNLQIETHVQMSLLIFFAGTNALSYTSYRHKCKINT